MTNDELLDGFAANQEMRGFRPATVRRRMECLSRLVKGTAPAGLLDLTEADLVEFLGQFRSASTRHAFRSDIRQFYRWAVKRKLLTENPADEIESIRQPKHLPRPVPPVELAAAIAAADGRVQLVLLLGALAGLRRAEVAGLHTDDIDLEAEHPTLTVRDGKGGKDRVVPLHPELAARLRPVPHGFVFPSPSGGHVAPAGLGRWVRDAFRRVGSTATMHQTRHYFGTAAAQIANGNIILVAQLMGHDKPETTMGYVKFDTSGGAEIVNRINPHTRPDELARRRQAAGQ